ncbi:nucleoprotein [Sinu virus]|uniref:Nucleoprotein n=1 Tax=Sinu virus TaxID=1927799 RepID=A0A1L5YKF6_9ORTO|nr:nucleoprotein [Sinu virus]APP91610.1 nucleoprotein [Sinu virus]
MSTNMEIDGFVEDKTLLKKMYTNYKELMKDLFEENGYTVVEQRDLYNLETIGTIISTMIYNSKIPDKKEWLPKRETTKYFKRRYILSQDKTNWAVEKIELPVLKIDITTARIQSLNLNTDVIRKNWMPFLASLQLANKTPDSIIYQKNIVTSELEVPSICEPFANGYQIKDKLKKSRRLSVGPLVHLNSIVKLQNRFTNGSRDIRGRNKRESILNRDAYERIKRDTVKILKRQSISLAQRKIIDQIAGGDLSLLSTLCISYLSIKPHIEHNFVLTYGLLYHTDDFEDATFVGEWVFEKVCKAAKNLIIVGQDAVWTNFLLECQIHGVFQSTYEDLRILKKMFGINFHQRKEMGTYRPNDLTYFSADVNLDYKFWSKPQKGAPINMKTTKSGQITTKPSFRGARKNINNLSTIDEIEASFISHEAGNIKEALEADFEAYKKIEIEGTGNFFKKGGNTVVNVILEGDSQVLLFSQ